MSAPRRTAGVVAAAAAAVLALGLAVTGCGGDGGGDTPATTAPREQTVRGAGYSHAAPAGWRTAATERGTTATGPGSQLLSVGVYKLVKVYVERRFDATAAELDEVAARLAADRKGSLTASETVTVAGRKARSYRIAYATGGADLVQQVTFVLRGTTEWLLVCRRAAGDPDEPCARLLASFRLLPAR